MNNTADPTLSISNTPKVSPVTVETFADVLMLHQVDSLDVDPWVQDLAVRSTNKLIARHGVDWIKENRVRLIQELELLNHM